MVIMVIMVIMAIIVKSSIGLIPSLTRVTSVKSMLTSSKSLTLITCRASCDAKNVWKDDL